MRTILIVAMLMMASCSGGKELAGAENAIIQFHRQLNSGEYRKIYLESDSGLKKVTPEANMIKLLDAVHRKLGAFQTGKQTGWQVNYSTSGTNTAVQFDSKFDRGSATETFTFVGDAQSPRLLSYNINSQALVTS